MAKSYSTSTQTIRTHSCLFQAASSFPRAEFHVVVVVPRWVGRGSGIVSWYTRVETGTMAAAR